MEQQPTPRHRTQASHRILSIMLMSGLTVTAFRLCAPSPAVAEVSTFHCRSAGLTLGKIGRERVEHFEDRHGHDIELWCVRGIFTAHYDLRVGSNDRSMTIAGCFFNHGTNTGPDISFDANGAFSKVEWTNEAPPSESVTYRFRYDYGTRMVAITAITPCHPPVSKVVAPQENFERLADLLPDPPEGSCPLKTPKNRLPPGG
jgi:hypothetical protein